MAASNPGIQFAYGWKCSKYPRFPSKNIPRTGINKKLPLLIKHAWFMQMMPSQAVYIKREKDEKNNESSGCRTNERSVSIYDGRRENPGYISVAVWWRWIIYDIFVWTFVMVDLSGVDFGSLPDEMIEKYSKVFSRGFMTDDMPERFISVSLRKLRRT